MIRKTRKLKKNISLKKRSAGKNGTFVYTSHRFWMWPMDNPLIYAQATYTAHTVCAYGTHSMHCMWSAFVYLSRLVAKVKSRTRSWNSEVAHFHTVHTNGTAPQYVWVLVSAPNDVKWCFLWLFFKFPMWYTQREQPPCMGVACLDLILNYFI